MAQIIGKVEQLNGKFYVEDENGNIRELKVGDEIKENETVIGNETNNNTNKLIISLTGTQDTIEILANGELKLDNTLLNGTPENDLTTTTRETLNDALKNVGREDRQQEEQENDTVVQTRTVEQTLSEDEENLELDFVDRTGDETDINSDLRVSNSLENGAIQAKFHGLNKSANNDFGNFVSRTGNETDINSDLRGTDNENYDDRDDDGDDDGIPALFGIINLSGDIIVGEGNEATYTLIVDNAPRTDLFVTLEITHLTTDSIDLPEETITVIIPAGLTEQTFTIDNFNDTPYDDGEEYKVTLVSTLEGGYTEITIGNDEVITEITDSISLPVLSIDDQVLYEDEGVMTFTVSLDKVAEDDVSFDYASSDNTANAGNDYTTVNGTALTIPAGQTSITITVPITDDYIADNGETFNITLTNQSSNAIIGDGIGLGTILDNSQENTPNNETDTNETDLESVTVKLVALDKDGNEVPANEVNEGSPASYKVVLEDPDGNRITMASGTVEVTFNGNTATDNTDYDSTTQIVNINTPFSTDTLDDYLSDNSETYNVQITDDTYSKASDYENVIHDTTPVVTTILDNSNPNTPNNPVDDTVETDVDTITIKLFAIDATDGSRQPANEVAEGSVAQYIAVAFDKNGTELNLSETVQVTFSGNTATDNVDYNSATQTVTLGQNFSTPTIDDYLSDDGETYNIQITDNSMSNDTNYETIEIDTTPVVTTINDNQSETPDISGTTPPETGGYDPVDDTVYVQLINDSSVGEGSDLVHGIQLVDSAGNPVMLEAGQAVTVALTYTGTSVNPTEGASDFTAQTSVTIVGAIGGNNSAVITNPSIDDFYAEGVEEYTISIANQSDISDDNSTFETIANQGSTVTGTISDGTNDTIPNQDVDTVYVQLSGDESVSEGPGVQITHTLTLVDKDDNTINLAAGETITFTVAYSNTAGVDPIEGGTSDLTVQTTNITITGDGGSTYTFVNTVTNDAVEEIDEGYTVNITSIDAHSGYFENVAIDTVNNSTGTITDIDEIEVASITSATEIELTSLVHTVTMTGDASISKEYDFVLADNTANEITDYDATSLIFSDGVTYNTTTGKISVPANVNTFTITVPSVGNSINEDTETYDISVGNTGNVISATGTITDDDTVGITITPDTVEEGTDLVHKVTLSVASQEIRTYVFNISDNTANATEDYENGTLTFTNGVILSSGNLTVPAGVTTFDITVKSVDNKISEPSEFYDISVGGVATTGTITDEVTPGIDDTVYAVLTGDTSVLEGSTANYLVSLLDIEGNSVTVSTDTIVNVTFTNNTTEDADTEYSNNQVIPVTILAGQASIALDTDTVDDYMSDNGEDYTLTISSIPTHEFEAIDFDGFTDSGTTVHVAAQTTTITDNTGTPNNDTTDENENSENPSSSLDIVEIKLIACDTSGNKLTDGSGNYILVNDVYEGDTPGYMALAFVPGTTVFNASTETPTQDGTVAVTFTDITAQGVSSFITKDGTQDFDNDGQTVTLGTAFYTDTFDDFTSDDGQTYNIQITDGTYTPPTPTTGYENVNIDITPVVTTINDDISIGIADNAYVDEDNFDVTNSSLNLTGEEHTTLGGSLDTTGNGTTGNATLLNITTAPSNYDDYTFSFDSTITAKMDSNSSSITPLESGGVTIEYVTVGDTITAYKGAGRLDADKVFDITLDKNAAGGADDGYTYTQYQNIDHQVDDNDDTVVLTFGYTLTNDSETSDVVNFDVVVNDSLPTAINDSRTTNEDTDLLIVISDEPFKNGEITLNNGVEDASANSTGPAADQVLNNGDTLNIYDNATDKNVVGVIENNGDGTLTFKPSTDFSGNTLGFSYNGATDTDGDSASGTIDLTVTPVADTPDMNGTNANLSEATITTAQTTEDVNNSSEGNQITTVGFILPTNEDGASNPGDYTGDNTNDDEIEKFGLISIIADDGIIITANGSDYTFAGGNPITVYINDVTDYHHADVVSGDADISLTQAQFEAIQVKHAEDDAVNPEFTISIDSYELNDNDTLKAGPIKANNTQDYEVDILAVTDPVTLVFNTNLDGNGNNKNETFTTSDEGTAGTIIDLAAMLNKTFGDNDGSEQRSYTVSGILEGTILNLGGNKVAAGSDGTATVNFPDNTVDNPSFTMTISEQYSGTINGTITLTALDTDDDSSGTISEQSDAVTFTMEINPVADIVTLQVKQAVGDEDAGRSNGNTANNGTIDDAINGIDLDIKVTSDDNTDISDGTTTNAKETYTVIIGENSTYDGIPDGSSIYYGGTTINKDTTSGGDFTITDNGSGSWMLSIANFNNDTDLKFIPVHNSDDDYIFNVDAYSTDTTAGNSVTQTLQIDVTVNEVADLPINDSLASTTVSDDASDNNSFNLSGTEDAGAINLKTVLATPSTSGDGSETLTMKVTNLTDGFDIQGATFLGGTGTSRIWFIDLADLQADSITLISPEHFAGEVNFDLAMVTTEDAGDSKTHDAQEVSIMIIPSAEATVNLTDTQDEDETITLDFGLTKPDSGGALVGVETLETFAIKISSIDAGVTLQDSSNNTLSDSGDGYAYLTVTNGVLETVTATIAEDSHMGGSYNFEISYTINDVAIDTDGNTYTDTKTVTDEVYTVTVNAITDDINLTTDNSDVTVTDNASFTKTLNVAGLDTDSRGNSDTDSSEAFTRVTVSGVPEGVTVVGGDYAGDTTNGIYSGFWYVNIADIVINDAIQTYDLDFNVDGAPVDGTYGITVTAYNEDNNNGVEQNDSETFNLIIATDGSWDGQNIGTPATIDNFTQDIDQDDTADHANAGITDSDAYEGSILREDTQFNLGSVVDVSTTNSSNFSITIKDLPTNVSIEGMTLNSDGYYTVSGNGDSSAIISKLTAILITPESNQNTDASDISASDLTFDIELTTYATGGASNTSLINFTASVLPVTDAMDLTVVNDGATTEDVNQTFSIKMDNLADGVNTTIVDGKVYLQITESFNDTQGTDGVAGLLTWDEGTMTTETNPTGLTAGTYYVISGVSYDQTLNFTYTPAEDRDASVDVEFTVKNIESETWNPFATTELLSLQTVSFDVTAVRDGFTFDTSSVASTGEEDANTANTVDGLIEVQVSVSNPDSSEELLSVSLDKIPDGFLVYYGTDEATATLAQNIGVNGQMNMEITFGVIESVDYNLWNIPLNLGEIPAYIGIKAPENWSGTISDVVFNAADVGGDIATSAFDVVVTPVVDTLTLNATKTFGGEGEDIALNLNANVDDLDGSETVTLTLDGLGANATFKANGIAIDTSDINYIGDVYTISNIAALDLNNLTFVQSTTSTTVTTTAQMFEDGIPTGSDIKTSSFDVSITESIASSSDDTLLYAGTTIDGLDGEDTLVLAGASLTFDDVDNIEILDLGAGENTLSNLTLQDVIDMTDTDNDLIILGDAADSVSLADSGDWTKTSDDVTETINGEDHTIDTWTNDTDNSVTIKVDDAVDGI